MAIDNVDTDDCATTTSGATCVVSCAAGYDNDADYDSDDSAMYTCGADGAWAADDAGSLTCAYVDYMDSFTSYQQYSVSGNNVAIAFTGSDGADYSSNKYLQTYCGTCSVSTFLDTAASLCASQSSCAGMNYYSAAG